MFSHMNLMSSAIGDWDPIFVPTQDMLIGLYIITSENRRGLCANWYNPSNHKNHQNEKIDISEKEPFFVIPIMQLELIDRKG
ncbi:hypothetical protein IC582_020823 [Cucumis melo]